MHPNDDHEADRTELLRLKDIVERAMSGEITTLKPFVCDGFSIVTFSGRQFADWDIFVREWNISRERYLEGATFQVVIDPKPAWFIQDTAICCGDSTNVLIKGSGKEFRFPSPWTAVCCKVDGSWKILRAHSSIDPFNNPMVRAGAKRLVICAAVAALVLGLAIGWVIATVAG